MKAKVTLTDKYSNRSINIICEVENIALVGESDKWWYNPELLSDYQRKKIENFFGKMNAYYTSWEIQYLIHEVKDIVEYVNSNGGFCNRHNWNYDEIAEWIKAQFLCTDKIAKEASYQIDIH